MISSWLTRSVLIAFCAFAAAEGTAPTADATEEHDPGLTAPLEESIARLTLAATVDGTPKLPSGTILDRAAMIDNVVHVDLTLPPGAKHWRASALDLEAISGELGAPFCESPQFAGAAVRVRTGTDQPYRPLEHFSSDAPWSSTPPGDVEIPDAAVSESSRRIFDAGLPASPGGPVSAATRQPAGALSGVVIFCSGGHGWTAGDSSWFLQRPLLWDMNEDHGNLDQLNNFVHFAFNAGATVVPFRPVGYQPLEIVLDNDDPGVTFTGAWSDGTGSKYYENGTTVSGIRYRSASAGPTESATARFTPEITETGFYPVYCFALAGSNRVPQTYRIKHSGGIAEIVVDHRNVGNGWVWLGEYHLESGGENYVEITNQSSIAGAVIADAIRWGNGVGDIVRPGPDTVSGYPRNEECHRYWAHSELGNHAVGFTASDIWDSSSDDVSDNVSTASRWAREMNQVPAGGVLVERWKRVYLEFHSNAFAGTARGCIALISDSAPTTYQEEYATFVADEVDTDLPVYDGDFEHTWVDRASATLAGAYGAISTVGNGNEFDATIIEVAFHDNQQDAELLRDSRVRAALGRASLQGIVRFLHSLPGSTVPLAFAPDAPENVRVRDVGGGDVVLSWDPPGADQARGDPATGYVVYESTNGYGFSLAAELGDELTATISGIPAAQTRYYRIAATNAGGESMPSETLAVRRPATGPADILIVSGFDRLRRQQNPTQTFTQPPAYAGGTIERQIRQRTNSYDYVVQFAEALAATTLGFASCANEAIIDSQVQLPDYDVVLWILGTESTEDGTLNSTEQIRIEEFLDGGGALFISGSNLSYDLIDQGGGASFMLETLRAGFAADDAGTFDVTGAAGGILADMGPYDFDPANGAPYVVYDPDVLTLQTGAAAVVNYLGGTGGVAGVQYDAGLYRTVTFGFPFEAINSQTSRSEILQRVIDYLRATIGPIPLDFDDDGDVDLADYQAFLFCFLGPGMVFPEGHFCAVEFDANGDRKVDLADFAVLQEMFTGPL